MTVSYEHRLLFRHEGPMDMELLPLFVHTVEKALIEEGSRTVLRRKVISSLIELAQNIIRYAVMDDKHPPLLLLSRTDNGFLLIARNLIHYSQEIFLQSYLQNLTAMSREEIEQLHYGTLTSSNYSDSGGAGLGLIQVILKADGFAYEFAPAEGEYRWFTIKASFHA